MRCLLLTLGILFLVTTQVRSSYAPPRDNRQDAWQRPVLIERDSGAQLTTEDFLQFVAFNDLTAIEQNLQSILDLLTAEICEGSVGDDAILHWAIENQLSSILEQCISLHAELNLVNQSHVTALLHAVAEKQFGSIAMLLEAGANPDLADEDGFTPLHLAVYSDQIDVIDVLLQHGADETLINEDGDTALHLALKTSNFPAIERLLISGVASQVRDALDRTPLDLARQLSFYSENRDMKQTVEMLVEVHLSQLNRYPSSSFSHK